MVSDLVSGNKGYWDFNDYLAKQKKISDADKANQKRYDDEVKRLEQAAAEQTRLSKKYGKKYCAESNLLGYAMVKKTPESGCLFNISYGNVTVLQQTNAGTIVHMQVTHYDTATYLIVANAKDKGLVYDQPIAAGVFENIGTFQYTNVLGATRTIAKFKRVE